MATSKEAATKIKDKLGGILLPYSLEKDLNQDQVKQLLKDVQDKIQSQIDGFINQLTIESISKHEIYHAQIHDIFEGIDLDFKLLISRFGMLSDDLWWDTIKIKDLYVSSNYKCFQFY